MRGIEHLNFPLRKHHRQHSMQGWIKWLNFPLFLMAYAQNNKHQYIMTAVVLTRKRHVTDMPRRGIFDFRQTPLLHSR
jgi:uncharacterized membrane-anchored protein YitT (DUF2179 family)